MAEGYRRADLKVLAEAKIKDARLLLDNKRFASAFYLAGYAIEVGLKACIARRILSETIPDKTLINSTYDHDVGKLANVAGLASELKKEQASNNMFAANWGIVGQWRVDSRYEMTDQFSAQLMVQAVDDPSSGVLQWIRQHW